MGRTTVTLIRHIALCDLAFIAIPVLPSLITHLLQRYIFGDVFCFIEIYSQCTVELAHITLVCLLAAHRLMRCVRPRREPALTNTLVTVILVTVYLGSVCVVMLTIGRTGARDKGICVGFLGSDSSDHHAVHRGMVDLGPSNSTEGTMSMPGMSGMSGPANSTLRSTQLSTSGLQHPAPTVAMGAPRPKLMRPIPEIFTMLNTSDDLLQGILPGLSNSSTVSPGKLFMQPESMHLLIALLVPFLGTIASNTAIWVLTCTRLRKFNYRPVMTVTVVSVQVILSWVPMMCILVFRGFVTSSKTVMQLDHLSLNLHLLGIITNPIVYTVFSQGFKDFFKQKVIDILTCVECEGGSMEECVPPTNLLVVRRQSQCASSPAPAPGERRNNSSSPYDTSPFEHSPYFCRTEKAVVLGDSRFSD